MNFQNCFLTYRWRRYLMILTSLAFACVPGPGFAADSAAKPLRVYIGTYTTREAEGIYRFDFDPATGKASDPVVAARTKNPSYLTLDSTENFLYAVNEVSDPIEGENYKTTGWVRAYQVDRTTGELTELNHQPSGGAIACYVAVDAQRRNALVANYTGGSISSFQIQPDGSLAPASTVVNHGRDAQAHQAARGHSFNFSPDERFAIAADAGLDEIFIYRFDAATGKFTPHTPPSVATGPQTAPRHFTFHPNGKWAYNNNERNFKINSFHYDAQQGMLTLQQTLSTLPEGVPEKGSTAEVLVHPSGKFVYVSNRGPDSIATYQIDAAGKLTFTGATPSGGKTPRNFRMDSSGTYLLAANQDSDTIVVFRIDQDTGALSPTGEVVHISKPVCIKFATVP